MSADNKRMLWIPPGFAHGFLVLSEYEYVEFLYKTTDYYAPEHERCIIWNDRAVGINGRWKWSRSSRPRIGLACPLREAEVFE